MDKDAIDIEALKISELQNKYLKMLLMERPILKRLEVEKKRLRGELCSYFRGEFNNKEDLDRIGRPPCQLKIKYSNLDEHIDQDPAWIKLVLGIIKQEEKVAALGEILYSLKWRGTQIRELNEWLKVKAGF